MKISDIQRLLIEQQGKVNKSRNTDAGSFQQIMDQVTSQTPINNTLPLSINPVQIIDKPAATAPVDGASETSGKDMVLGSLKDTLDLIDFYAGKLGDSSFPTENLSSLVDQLDDRLTAIKGMSSAEDMPEKLKPVVSDIAVTLGTEIERFRRGDYV